MTDLLEYLNLLFHFYASSVREMFPYYTASISDYILFQNYSGWSLPVFDVLDTDADLQVASCQDLETYLQPLLTLHLLKTSHRSLWIVPFFH